MTAYASAVSCTRKKMISLGSWLIACCKLAPTVARQIWRHNYVIDRNEYLIFTWLESVDPWVYSLQFLFKSTNNSWRYERKCERVFFSEHSVYWALSLLGSWLDLSRSRDVISHMTIRFPIGYFLFAFSVSFSFSHDTYVTDRRQTDRKTQNCSISATVSTVG